MLELLKSIVELLRDILPRRGGKRPRIETIDTDGSVWDKPAESNERSDEKLD